MNRGSALFVLTPVQRLGTQRLQRKDLPLSGIMRVAQQLIMMGKLATDPLCYVILQYLTITGYFIEVMVLSLMSLIVSTLYVYVHVPLCACMCIKSIFGIKV